MYVFLPNDENVNKEASLLCDNVFINCPYFNVLRVLDLEHADLYIGHVLCLMSKVSPKEYNTSGFGASVDMRECSMSVSNSSGRDYWHIWHITNQSS